MTAQRGAFRTASLLLLAGVGAVPLDVAAGVYIFASTGSGLDSISHPKAYSGTGGALTMTVCISPASVFQAEMVVPVQNAIDHYNQLVATTGNLRSGGDNEMAGAQFDYESVITHELGHCIGLGHPNAATESGQTGNNQNYTKAEGMPGSLSMGLNLDDGADNIIGSFDDIRGDDINLHWYRRGVDNPFLLSRPVVKVAYARDLGFLPAGHTFAENADRTVATARGFPNTEAVMQQGQFNDEDQRGLQADDVTMLMLARTGIDGAAATADDYSLSMTYGGVASGCDVTVTTDAAFTGFAQCSVGGSTISGGANVHWRITSATLTMNDDTSWFFATARVPSPALDTATVAPGATVTTVNGVQTSLLANDTHPTGAPLSMGTTAFPGPAHGSVTLNSNGTFSYTHNGDAAVSDEFVYRVCVTTNANACSHQRVALTITQLADAIFANGYE